MKEHTQYTYFILYRDQHSYAHNECHKMVWKLSGKYKRYESACNDYVETVLMYGRKNTFFFTKTHFTIPHNTKSLTVTDNEITVELELEVANYEIQE